MYIILSIWENLNFFHLDADPDQSQCLMESKLGLEPSYDFVS